MLLIKSICATTQKTSKFTPYINRQNTSLFTAREKLFNWIKQSHDFTAGPDPFSK